MRGISVVAVAVLIIAVPSFAKTHKDMYSVPCSTLWPAVKDTLRNSGKYGILGMVDSEMTATYSMGIGSIGQKRSNTVVLNAKGDTSCEMLVQSGFSGWTNDDAGDFKKRVDKSLAQLSPPQTSAPAKPDNAAK